MSAPSSPLLSLDKIGYSISGRVLLSDVSFKLFPGEIMTLVGPNGAGKTTLLKIILGLKFPTSGAVTFSKKPQIGYMPQRLSIDTTLPLTVERFLRLSHEGDVSINETLRQVGARKLLNRSMHVLSGGEFQRVLLAKALLKKPNLLVLDEPGQGVDSPGQSTFYGLINDLRHQLGCAVLLVSHDLHFVHAASDQVICLNRHICCAGHPEEVQKNPEYLALFGEAFQKGLAPYTHKHDHSHDVEDDETLERGDKKDE